MMEEQLPRYRRQSQDNNHQYYLQYKKLYQQSLVLSQYYHQMGRRQRDLNINISELNERAEGFRDCMRPEAEEFRKKKNRRTADQIHKDYVCPIERCDRKYGTEASLRIHLKKKHSEAYEPKKRGKGSKRDLDSPNQSSP